jgi:branched-chain amino acid transport system permease protein
MREAFCVADSGVGLASDMAIFALLALSAWLVLRTGRISLGQQAFFALGAYAAGLFTVLGHWPLLPALLVGMGVGATASALVAMLTLRLGGLHYAVATLAFAELVRLGLSSWRWRVREVDGTLAGPDGVDGFRDIRWLLENQVTPEAFLQLTAVAVVLVLLALACLSRTRAGTAMLAVGHDDTLASACGFPVDRLRVLAAALAGALAALGGGLYAHRVTFLDPAAFDPMLGVHAVGYALIGGLATAAGPLLGVAFDLGLLEATKLFDGWRMVVFGGLVALFLRWRPRGLLDEALVHRMTTAWRQRFNHPPPRTTHAHP